MTIPLFATLLIFILANVNCFQVQTKKDLWWANNFNKMTTRNPSPLLNTVNRNLNRNYANYKPRGSFYVPYNRPSRYSRNRSTPSSTQPFFTENMNLNRWDWSRMPKVKMPKLPPMPPMPNLPPLRKRKTYTRKIAAKTDRDWPEYIPPIRMIKLSMDEPPAALD